MNEPQREELREIRAEQRALQARLALLETRLARFDATEAVDGPVKTVAAPDEPAPIRIPVVPLAPAPALPMPAVPVMLRDDPTPSLPPPLPPPPARTQAVEPLQAASSFTRETAQDASSESLEMRIGTTWLARAGIVLLLTSLAFFGSYLYHNVVPHLGPAAKVTLLYLGAGALAGAGAWLERSRQARESPKLRNYARVVLAGGLAAVYYVTYAAHYFENLRVIGSPLLAGALLLGWSAFMVWVSDRRQSETLATLAILLGFYTSAINESVGAFTLFSNLALSGGAVFLLRRHLWKIFPFASLLASFGSYAFWNYFRFYVGLRDLDHLYHQPVTTSPGGFWVVCSFLAVYWALFTWAAFTSDERVLPTLRRAGFVSLNNGAFFTLVMWRLFWAYPGTFWEWSLVFGGVLLVLAETCRRLPRPLDANTENAYLLQGVLLVTLGFISYFSGWQLSLMLGVQSVTLLAASGRRSSRLLLGASVVSALLSCGWAAGQLANPGVQAPWSSGLGVGIFLVVAAWLAQRALDRPPPATAGTPLQAPYQVMLAPMPAYYAALGLGIWLVLIEQSRLSAPVLILTFAAAGLALTASVYALRVRAIPFYAQAFLLAGLIHWIAQTVLVLWPPTVPSNRITLALLVAILAAGHWFARLPGVWWSGGGKEHAVSRLDAVLAVLLIFVWVRFSGVAGAETYALWTAELAGLSLAVLGYGTLTGYRAFAVAGQGLLVASVGYFFQIQTRSVSEGPAEPYLALVPLAAILLTLAADHFLGWAERPRPATRRFKGVYEGTAVVLFLTWNAAYFPWQGAFALDCAACGAVAMLGVQWRERRFLLWSGVLLSAAVIVFGVLYTNGERRHWLNLFGILALIATQQFGRRRLSAEDAGRFFPAAAQAALMIAATLSAWAVVTAWARVFQPEGGFATVVGWSLFAPVVFAGGMLLQEKVYRWLALVVLGATLLHVIVFEVWQLDLLGRAVSLLSLGLIALGIGFLYNRFHAKFRELF